MGRADMGMLNNDTPGMRTITLDLAEIDSIDGMHRYLKEMFGFPEYYGMNLDALHDELTSIREDTAVVFAGECLKDEGSRAENEDGMAAYITRMRRVFEDAAEENRFLHL